MKHLFLVFTILMPFFAMADADVVNVIDKLRHVDFENFITTAYSYDESRGVVCISASATRYSGGATSSNKCYRSNTEPSFSAENYGEYKHGGRNTNTVTTFKVSDLTNDIVCYGTLITRRGVDSDFGKTRDSGASISMDCL